MGRPKGSKNKKGSKKHKKHLRSGNFGIFKKSGKNEIVIPSDIRTCKFFGYCRCDFMITRFELVTKHIYKCPRCGKRDRISTLKDKMKRSGEKLTKKEFLRETAVPFNRDHYHSGREYFNIEKE